jgi:hypothetical protein
MSYSWGQFYEASPPSNPETPHNLVASDYVYQEDGTECMHNSLIWSKDKNLWTLEHNPPSETWSVMWSIYPPTCYGIPKFNNIFTGIWPKSDKFTTSTYIILYDQLQCKPPIYATSCKPAYFRPVLRFIQRKHHERKKCHSVTVFVTFLAFTSPEKKTHSLTIRMPVRCTSNWLTPSWNLVFTPCTLQGHSIGKPTHAHF